MRSTSRPVPGAVGLGIWRNSSGAKQMVTKVLKELGNKENILEYPWHPWLLTSTPSAFDRIDGIHEWHLQAAQTSPGWRKSQKCSHPIITCLHSCPNPGHLPTKILPVARAYRPSATPLVACWNCPSLKVMTYSQPQKNRWSRKYILLQAEILFYNIQPILSYFIHIE